MASLEALVHVHAVFDKGCFALSPCVWMVQPVNTQRKLASSALATSTLVRDYDVERYACSPTTPCLEPVVDDDPSLVPNNTYACCETCLVMTGAASLVLWGADGAATCQNSVLLRAQAEQSNR